MGSWKIENTRAGHVLGLYPGETAAEALDEMARAAGYRDHVAACEVAPVQPGELIVTEIGECDACGDVGHLAELSDHDGLTVCPTCRELRIARAERGA